MRCDPAPIGKEDLANGPRQIREGTGFSLAVAGAQAEFQDGRPSLSSEGVAGMTVTITFPSERVLADSEDPLPTMRPAVSRTAR